MAFEKFNHRPSASIWSISYLKTEKITIKKLQFHIFVDEWLGSPTHVNFTLKVSSGKEINLAGLREFHIEIKGGHNIQISLRLERLAEWPLWSCLDWNAEEIGCADCIFSDRWLWVSYTDWCRCQANHWPKLFYLLLTGIPQGAHAKEIHLESRANKTRSVACTLAALTTQGPIWAGLGNLVQWV